MSDQLPTATRVSDPGIRALYRLENRWQAWLDVEVALARAQAELGIIPADAAEAIARAARLELLDRARIDEGFARTGHTIVPLVWELSPRGRRAAWRLGALGCDDAEHHADRRPAGAAPGAPHLPAPDRRGADRDGRSGRTRRGHADARAARMASTRCRRPSATRSRCGSTNCCAMSSGCVRRRPRLFVAMLGGGAGTFASLGKQGPPVQAGIGKQLGFGTMTVPSRALGDHLAENICLLGLLAATCGKIGREIYTLMKTEFGEVEEPVPPGTVGSSTMPQKRNPKLCQDIIAASAEVRAMVPLALEAMQTEHEADRTTSLMMDSAEARACIETGDMLARLGEVMRGLRLDPARMRRNLDLGGGLIMAEAVMLELGADDRAAARARRGV